MDDLARRAVACPGWRWRPGMRTLPDARGRVYRLRDHGGRCEPMLEAGPVLRQPAPPESEWLPDLTDPATLGCVLALWDESRPRRSTPCAVTVALGQHGLADPRTAAALIAALEAAP